MAAGLVSAVHVVAEMASQVRQSTLQLLHVPDPGCLTWSPPGTSNHMLWHAGHALWLQDALSIRPLTGHSELPRGWSALFGQDSEPAATANWPEQAEVQARLVAQLQRILELLDEHANTIVMQARLAPPTGSWPLLPGMIHGWHDEARHQGEMYLLHKLCREQLR
jgi:hypothetical protein